MPTVTDKGYKLPIVGERGTWWQNIIDNFTRLSSHKHDGIDSVLLTPPAVVKDVEDVLAANWVLVANGTYRQLLTTPTNHVFPKVNVLFYINGGPEDGSLLNLTVEPQSTTTYYVYINDNSLSLKAIYA